MKKLSSIKLKHVSSSDYRFLYVLLKKRDPRANISHRKMPTYKQHRNFVKSKPYAKWYIIQYGNSKVGSIYLSKSDEIGIFLKKEMQGKHVGTIALNLLIAKNPRRRYLANVNPKNSKSIKFFKRNNFKLISYTYEFETDYKN